MSMNNYLMPQAQYGNQNPYPYACPQCTTPRSEVNAVKIELINPQAYGGSQQPAPQQPLATPPQAPVYSYPQAPIYSAPQAQMMPQPMPQMPYIPQQPLNITPQDNNNIPPKAPEPPAGKQPPSGPSPDISPVPAPPAENFTPDVPTAAQEPTSVINEPNVPPVEENPQSSFDIAPIVTSLKSDNLEEQFNAIQKIAEVGQTRTPDSDALINEQIFQGLADIVTRDTSQMQGPSPQQIELREKLFSGEELSTQEAQVAEQLSPQEVAEMNKQYATYTLAVMQKDFRDTVNVEAEKQGLEPVKLNEIPEIDTVIENVKSNPNPLIREASISALSYIAEPGDKEPLSIVFELAQEDSDPMVQESASKALSKLN